MAVFLVRCLRAAGYFGEPPAQAPPTGAPGTQPSEEEVAAGGKLLLLLQILQFNAHEVSELQVKDLRDLESGRSVFLGGAIYPTLALFNHSCDPGIVRYNSQENSEEHTGNDFVASTKRFMNIVSGKRELFPQQLQLSP